MSLTGVAGPAEQDGQPVGTLWVGIATASGTEARVLRLGGQRDLMRQFSVIASLDLLRRHLARAVHP
jgi:nicotinamide mononucleotide (NMN) deamidase PncC